MIYLTKAQRQALKIVYLRITDTPTLSGYRALRRHVEGTFFMDSAIVVPFYSMFLVIETDGYTHS